MTDIIKVAGVQMDVELGAVDANLTRMEEKLAETAAEGATLTVFPECASTGYCFDSKEEALPFAETVPGDSTERMTAACRKHGVFSVFGMLEIDGDDLFNACVLVGPDGVVGGYRKIHLPFLGIDRFTTPGNRPFAVHQAGAARIGMNICYDAAFPESSRVMTLQGADLIVLPTNWPPGAQCMSASVVGARAMENGVYYMAVNRVGVERGFEFIGGSKICETSGRIVVDAEHRNEAILYAEIDLARARNKHVVRVPKLHEINRLADRRPEMYGEIVEPVKHVRPS